MFNVPIGVPDPTPKERAQALLIFDGLMAIRNAIAGQVQRIRIVTCKIGDDTDFMSSVAWVLGVMIEAYDVKVYAGQVNAAARFKFGLCLNPNNYDDVTFEANAETELPSQHVVLVGVPSPCLPGDPLCTMTSSPITLLGDCASLVDLIPANVLTQ